MTEHSIQCRRFRTGSAVNLVRIHRLKVRYDLLIGKRRARPSPARSGPINSKRQHKIGTGDCKQPKKFRGS